jgi:hypothetical protein
MMIFFWILTQYKLIDGYQHFGEILSSPRMKYRSWKVAGFTRDKRKERKEGRKEGRKGGSVNGRMVSDWTLGEIGWDDCD